MTFENHFNSGGRSKYLVRASAEISAVIVFPMNTIMNHESLLRLIPNLSVRWHNDNQNNNTYQWRKHCLLPRQIASHNYLNFHQTQSFQYFSLKSVKYTNHRYQVMKVRYSREIKLYKNIS